MIKIQTLALWGGVALLAAFSTGCKTEMPKPSGFLSDYSRLKEANDSTWQYVDSSGLAACDKFTVAPVKVMVRQYWGTTFTTDQQQSLSAVFSDKIVKALGPRFQMESTVSPTTGEIRVALTQAFRVGNALAIGAEAEILNSQSHQQLAAVTGSKIGPPEMGINTSPRTLNSPADPSTYMAAWWNQPAADELMDRWAEQIVKIIDSARKK